MGDVVHIATNNLPSEAKVHELVQNAIAENEQALPEEPESFSVLPVTVDPVEQAITSIRSAVSAILGGGEQPHISNLIPPPGVIGFKK